MVVQCFDDIILRQQDSIANGTINIKQGGVPSFIASA